jgi:sorting and assembly machinery component 37
LHLGLSSLDIDSDTTNSQKDEGVIPPSLRKPRTTISSLLSQTPENAAQIRLDALATSFLEPLQSLRGKKRYFVSQSPTSLDCLAFGCLSLALLPDLPSPWLANSMRSKFPQLCAFVHDLQRSYFNGAVSLEDAYLTTSSTLSGEEAEKERERRRRASGKAALPWSPPDRGGVLALGGILASNVADTIPGISQLRHAKRLERELESTAEDEEERYEAVKTVAIYRRELWITTAAVIGAVGLMVGYMFHYGLLAPLIGGEDTQEHSYHGSAYGHGSQENEDEYVDEDDREETATPLAQFGDLGAALEALPRSWTGPPPPPVPAVELDVEADGQRV